MAEKKAEKEIPLNQKDEANQPEDTQEKLLSEEEQPIAAEKESEEQQDKSFFGKKKSAAEIKKLTDQLAEKDAQLAEYKERYARLAAEFDNYKKRTSREMDARYSDAKGDVLKGLLPVLDNFGRALAADIPESCKAYREGVEMIFQQFTGILQANGVEEIEALGKEFDPAFHNALMHVEDEALGENQIAEVFEKGYRMGDKVLRYSMVKVAN